MCSVGTLLVEVLVASEDGRSGFINSWVLPSACLTLKSCWLRNVLRWCRSWHCCLPWWRAPQHREKRENLSGCIWLQVSATLEPIRQHKMDIRECSIRWGKFVLRRLYSGSWGYRNTTNEAGVLKNPLCSCRYSSACRYLMLSLWRQVQSWTSKQGNYQIQQGSRVSWCVKKASAEDGFRTLKAGVDESESIQKKPTSMI